MTRHRNALLFAVRISENYQGTARCPMIMASGCWE